MAQVSEDIPAALQPRVDAAIARFNLGKSEQFKVTGIVDAEQSLTTSEPRKLQLVLCGGDICQRQDFLVGETDDGYDVSYESDEAGRYTGSTGEQAELDPPPGARREWLSTTSRKHDFIVLLFYRGFW